jgi:hypothetical protein
MAKEAVFSHATVEQFRALFQPKREYREAIREMDLKERMFNWKPTTELEERLQSHLVKNALVKVGSGRLRVTSYRLSDQGNQCSAFLSYGGKALQVTAEGREDDFGFFLTATQGPEGLTIRAESKREHYKLRTRVVNLFLISLGLVMGILPGIVLAAFFFFVEPRVLEKKIERNVWPPLSALLGERR